MEDSKFDSMQRFPSSQTDRLTVLSRVLYAVPVAMVFFFCLPSELVAYQHNRMKRIDDHFSTRIRDRQGFNRRQETPQQFRSIDGSGNNVRNTIWGSAGSNFWRRTPADYADGFSEPSGGDRPNPRAISNAVFDQQQSQPNRRGLTDMVWQWGQFLDHDITLTGETHFPLELLPIDVPAGDIWFDPTGSGAAQIMLFRSAYNPNTGITGPRQQSNLITSWIDGSNVYGSDEDTMNSLRHFTRGMLRVSPNPTGQLLPVDSDGFFLAGDVRANEQVYLTSMHTLFMREHNRVCRRLLEVNPNLTDEQTFQYARRRVIATMQAITFEEFLPALLGKNSIPSYRGYNANVFPNITNTFSTSAYRFGHSMLSSQLLRLDENGNEISEGHIELANAFFNPDELKLHGIEPYLRGLTWQVAQEIDGQIVGDVRNFLFGPPGAGGFDLVSLNIQRGRDHGLPSMNVVRRSYGLPPILGFEDLSSDPTVVAKLTSVYDDVDQLDSWVGMLCEDHVSGASMGTTAYVLLRDQFLRIRDADRFWYEREFSGNALEGIRADRLSKVIRRNSTYKNPPYNVFQIDN